jgi:hypothetical protein
MAENAHCGLRIAECRIRNQQFEIRTLAVSLPVRLLTFIFCFVLIAIAPAQTLDQQQPIEPRLPPVRCTIAPTKDAVRWRRAPSTPGTPIAPATKEDQSDGKVESLNSASKSEASNSKDSSSDVEVIDLSLPMSERQLVREGVYGDTKLQTTGAQLQTPNAKHETPNADSSDIASAKSERQISTDAWFQIPTETPESTDIQEAVLTTSVNDNTKVEPQPLVQVLANLARQAQRNFVDPGIPSTETITYNFADSDLDPWEAFTRIVETRGYRIIYRGDIVSLAQNEQDSPNPGNAYKVKAEIWLDQSAKPGAHQSSLAIQVADTNVAPNNKPRAVRLLQPGSNTEISLIDTQSERGDSTVRLTVNPVLLPNGNVQADLAIDNAAPSPNGHKSGAIRRTTKFTIELTPTKQAIEIDGLLMPNNDPNTGKQAWFQRLFRKRAPANGAARMVVRLTVEPAAGSETPIRTDSPVRIPRSDSGKTGIALAPGQVQRTPELTSIQTLKH